MDFSERKCSGGGLGTKNGPVISLKMVANLILNLSVFHFVSLCFCGRTDRQARADRQTGGGGQTDRQTFPDLSADGQTDRA